MRTVSIVAALMVASLSTAWGAEPNSGDHKAKASAPNAAETTGVDRDIDVVRPFSIEHRMFFRFRPEMLVGGDLGPGSSGVSAPLAATPANGASTDNTLAWASVRFRYEPIFKLGSQLEIHIGVDVLRNLILGTTHANAGGDFNQGLWRDAQESPVSGINAFQDALEIRHLYGHWRAFDLVDVYGGRMVDHWGLGIMRNDGRGDDADFGSIIDRIMLGVSFGDIRIEASLEFTAIGATTANPLETYGQPMDLGQDDDVSTYTLRVFSRPQGAEQKAERLRLLEQRRHVGFDWGALFVFTDQGHDSLVQPDTSGDCAPPAGAQGVAKNGLKALPAACYLLTPRDAFFFKPSLWAKLEWRPDFTTQLRVEWEFAMVIGNVENLQNSVIEGITDTSKDWLAVATALEVELKMESLRVGLNFGLATGDERRYLGYNDGQNITTPDDRNYESDQNVRDNGVIESFWFNRDYRLDLILFRQVIGGVTNAVYLKPWVGYDIGLGEDVKITTELDLLYAAALDPQGTPGQGKHYGVEIDAHVGLAYDQFQARLSGGVLIPMDALEDRESGASPSIAYTVMGSFTWRY